MNYSVTITAGQHPLLINQNTRLVPNETATHVVAASTLSTLRIQEAKGVLALSNIAETEAQLTVINEANGATTGGSTQIVEVEVEVPVDRPIEVIKTVHEIKEIPIEKKVYVPKEITTDTRTYFSFDDLELSFSEDSTEPFLDEDKAGIASYVASSAGFTNYSEIHDGYVAGNQANRSLIKINPDTGKVTNITMKSYPWPTSIVGSVNYLRMRAEHVPSKTAMLIGARGIAFYTDIDTTTTPVSLGELALGLTSNESSTYVYSAIVLGDKLYLHVTGFLIGIDIPTRTIEFKVTAINARSNTSNLNSYHVISELDGILITNSGLIFNRFTGEIYSNTPTQWATETSSRGSELFQINIDEYRILMSVLNSSVSASIYYLDIIWDRETKTATVTRNLYKPFINSNFIQGTMYTSSCNVPGFEDGFFVTDNTMKRIYHVTKYLTTPTIIRNVDVNKTGSAINAINKFYNLKSLTFDTIANIDYQGKVLVYSKSSGTSGNYVYYLQMGAEVIGLQLKQS